MEQSGKNSKRFIVKYCRYCRKTFEINSYGSKRFVSYYNDMPTYGLERKSCPKHDHTDDDQWHEERL